MQGFNMGRYVPPEHEGTTSGNQLHGKKHAPGRGAGPSRDRRATPTVRFEMPYAIWCLSCPKPTIVGQGVRFNAEKERTGSYYTTPIWTFTIRHADCGGVIKIETDPKNTAYVVASGARKRDTGDDAAAGGGAGEYRIVTDLDREPLRRDAFSSLEKTIADREQAIQSTHRTQELIDASDTHWRDPGAQNKKLRDTFRQVRKKNEQQARSAEALRDKLGLAIAVLPESEEDAARASLVEFCAADPNNDSPDRRALSRPLFGPNKPRAAATKKAVRPPPLPLPPPGMNLMSRLVEESKAASDPFLITHKPDPQRARRMRGVKRKHMDDVAGESAEGRRERATCSVSVASLVNYDSE